MFERNYRVVNVYSKPGCVQCNATYKMLERKGITYQSIDITQDREALQYVTDLGATQAPVVVTGTGEWWAGFHPDRIASLAA